MALSKDALQLCKFGGKTAVILREIEALQLAVQSVAAQQAKLNQQMCDLKTLDIKVKESHTTFTEARIAFQNAERYMRRMLNYFEAQQALPVKKSFTERIKACFSKREEQRHDSDFDDSDY